VIHFFWDRILGTYRRPDAGQTQTNGILRIGGPGRFPPLEADYSELAFTASGLMIGNLGNVGRRLAVVIARRSFFCSEFFFGSEFCFEGLRFVPVDRCAAWAREIAVWFVYG
jgi:hypothetical protein